MCRMVAVRMKKKDSCPFGHVKKALEGWGKSQPDGTGVSYFAQKDGETYLTYFKSNAPGHEFFTYENWESRYTEMAKNGGLPTMIAHARSAVSGNLDYTGAHPFEGKRGGHTIHITHNGWITDEDALKKLVGELGKKAESEVDSEYLARLIEEHGIYKFPGILVKNGIEGKINILVHRDDGLIQAFSHGDLSIYEDDDIIVIATEPFAFPMDGDTKKDGWKDIDPGTVITVATNGKVYKKNVAVPKKIRRYSSLNTMMCGYYQEDYTADKTGMAEYLAWRMGRQTEPTGEKPTGPFITGDLVTVRDVKSTFSSVFHDGHSAIVIGRDKVLRGVYRFLCLNPNCIVGALASCNVPSDMISYCTFIGEEMGTFGFSGKITNVGGTRRDVVSEFLRQAEGIVRFAAKGYFDYVYRLHEEDVNDAFRWYIKTREDAKSHPEWKAQIAGEGDVSMSEYEKVCFNRYAEAVLKALSDVAQTVIGDWKDGRNDYKKPAVEDWDI